MKSLQTMVMWFRITNDAKAWEERGETTTQRISKQCIGGAMEKRDQQEWVTNGRSARVALRRES